MLSELAANRGGYPTSTNVELTRYLMKFISKEQHFVDLVKKPCDNIHSARTDNAMLVYDAVLRSIPASRWTFRAISLVLKEWESLKTLLLVYRWVLPNTLKDIVGKAKTKARRTGAVAGDGWGEQTQEGGGEAVATTDKKHNRQNVLEVCEKLMAQIEDVLKGEERLHI
eukprot:GHVQ01010515.1.p1 GENE.GHVQ01010515.1~~GHVQ01010515.1.p1  ORF type:complete len:169 (-),score=30.73 GHVQ01010515.1:607-1113(-)